MKCLVMLLLVVVPGTLLAQTPGGEKIPAPSVEQAVAAFAVRAPDEGSPFFADRAAAQQALAQPVQGRGVVDGMALYPRSKNSSKTAAAMFTSFFTDMFASVKWNPKRTGPTTQKLEIDPEDFSLEGRNDVEAVYTVRNNTGKIIRFDYATTQRIDMVTTDSSGAVLEKWSNDRAFEPQDGIVILNPDERIEYREEIATRDMKPGESYELQAEITGYPKYTVEKTLTPNP